MLAKNIGKDTGNDKLYVNDYYYDKSNNENLKKIRKSDNKIFNSI